MYYHLLTLSGATQFQCDSEYPEKLAGLKQILIFRIPRFVTSNKMLISI